jgi:CubicO group peptidase (beta-lactamase class C family)
MNKPGIRAQPIVSFGGIGTAHSLAKFYSILANDSELFSRETIGWMKEILTDGLDRTFQIPTAFSAGFMKDSISAQGAAVSGPPTRQKGRTGDRPSLLTRRIFGPSASAFGHPGAGGSHAFADPENKIAFAYVMNQMQQTVLPNAKSLRLVDAIYNSL